MRFAKTLSAVLVSVLVGGASARADAGGDLARLLKDYRDGARSLSAAIDPERGNKTVADSYDADGIAKYLTARRQLNQNLSGRLIAVSKEQLSPADLLSYDIFRWDLEDEAAELAPGIAERFWLLPLNQFDGRHLGFAREMQYRTDTPLSEPKDYDRAISRMIRFTRWLDSAILRMRAGIAEGVVQPRIIVTRMIAETESFIVGDPEEGVFMGPLKHMPERIAAEDRARLADAYREAVNGQLIPAYRRLSDFLKTEYLPKARVSAGLSGMPGGRQMYLYLVKSETTENMTPDAIHALGLSEIKRLEAAMDVVKKQTGFTGTLAAFRQYLRTDPRFKFKDSDAMMAEFTRVKDAAEKRLDSVTSLKPRSNLTFRFLEDFAAPYRPAAEYRGGNGNRAGIVYLNNFDLPSRLTFTSEALELHEGLPGHHLQVALAAENRSLPQFRRYGGETAFTEGWGLYAESLGPELGLYTDAYQKFGALSFDAWRSARLVIDTGLHWLGWSREQAIQFLTAHTTLSQAEASEEVERYIAIPGQALAYKIGEQKFLRLRERAKQALGPRFDLRRFHDSLLRDGAMPLPILDAKMDRWIEQEKSAS